MNHTFSVVVADDHHCVRAGVCGLIEHVPGLRIAGTARNTRELAEVLDSQHCDLVVTDLGMPGLSDCGNAMGFLRKLLQTGPRPKVVVLTMISQPQMLTALVHLGVSAIVDKRDAAESLLTAIEQSRQDALYLSTHARVALASSGGMAMPRSGTLSEREWEVFRLYVQGWPVSGIATRLARSTKTISTQKRSAMRKLGLDSERDLIAYARQIGLV